MPDPKRYASKTSLTFEVQDVFLPTLQEWVRARPITNEEGTRLEYLPNLIGFTERAEAWEARDPKVTKDPKAEAQLAVENQLYQNHVAHLSVIDPDDAGAPRAPEACDECNFAHPPSLWTVAQCSLLKDIDLGMIVAVALNLKGLDAIRPFSGAETPPSTPPRAKSSASTRRSTS